MNDIKKTARLEVLENSLAKKKAKLEQRFDTHFASVKQANGQPLNDKRGGWKVIAKWEKQSDGIHALQDSIKRTEAEKIGVLQFRKGKTFKGCNVRPKGFFVDCVVAGRLDLVKALDRGWHCANLAEPMKLPDGSVARFLTAEKQLEAILSDTASIVDEDARSVYLIIERFPYEDNSIVGIRFDEEEAIELRDKLKEDKPNSQLRVEKWTEKDERAFDEEKEIN